MALLISCGEVSSTQFTILRLLNQSLDSLTDNVFKILSPILTNLRDFEMRMSRIDRTQSNSINHSHSYDSVSNRNDYNQRKDPEAEFNVLDSFLKTSLDRLASLRENVCSTETFRYDDVSSFIMRDLCLQGKLDAALWLRRKSLDNGFVPDLITHNHLINGLCKLGNVEKADGLIREMKEFGPWPNLVSYNTFIKGLCSVNKMDKAMHMFYTLDGYGVKPNRVTCNIIVHALCQKGHMISPKVFGEILDRCGQAKESLDVGTCTILIDSWIRNGNVDQAFKVWKETDDVKADSVLYNVMIRGLCSSGNTVTAYGLVCDMVKRGVKTDVYTFNTLINGLCKEGKFDEACGVISIMKRFGVTPDRISYKGIIRGLCMHGDVDRGKEILLSMSSSLIQDVLLWNVVIDGYGKYGDIESVLSVWKLMVSYGVKPNVYTNNGLIRGLMKRGEFADAFRIKDRFETDTTTFNMLLGAACTKGYMRLAFWLYEEEMVKRRCRPDLITRTELIRGLCWKGRFKEAEEHLLRLMKDSGVTMDHVPFWILMKKYMRLWRLDEAYLVYKKWLMVKEHREEE